MTLQSTPGVYIPEPHLLHADERGSFSNIPFELDWSELNLVVTDANVVRGNHFHRYSTELFILIEGHIIVQAAVVRFNNGGGYQKYQVNTHEFSSGDIFYISPLTWHRFNIISASKWIALMSLPHETSKHDIVRMD